MKTIKDFNNSHLITVMTCVLSIQRDIKSVFFHCNHIQSNTVNQCSLSNKTVHVHVYIFQDTSFENLCAGNVLDGI